MKTSHQKKKNHFVVLVLAILITGCAREPEPIEYGSDECVYCRMIISEHQFGAVLVTSRGRSEKFDAVECMGAFIIDGKIEEDNIYSLWVGDFENPGELIDATEGGLFHSPNLTSPMGLNVSAYSSDEFAHEMMRRYDGEIIDWDKVLDLVEQVWLSQWGR